jgi:hypothetical protein
MPYPLGTLGSAKQQCRPVAQSCRYPLGVARRVYIPAASGYEHMSGCENEAQ